MSGQFDLFVEDREELLLDSGAFVEDVVRFSEFGKRTVETVTEVPHDSGRIAVPTFVNEFWTAKQRAAHSLHEISYRACFKPQLPRFFVTRLTEPGQVVYDPFMGRGTTVLESGLLRRRAIGTDVNPLGTILVKPRFAPPTSVAVARRLQEIDFQDHEELPEELLAFYHTDTLREICALKNYLIAKDTLDSLDEWIRMVAINRLTGHSRGFFSVYTMPPNQAVSVKAQRKINERRKQVPEYRSVADAILRKTRSLLRSCDQTSRTALEEVASGLVLIEGDSEATPLIEDQSVDLVVTSPPFLDVVNYATDNWLRCWFIGVNAEDVPISILKKLSDWETKMSAVFVELHRVLRKGAHVAFEVGEIRGGKIRLEESVIPAGMRSGLEPVCVVINDQEFTKTANCWGVDNNQKGTNTNRIVVFKRP